MNDEIERFNGNSVAYYVHHLDGDNLMPASRVG